MMKTAKKSNRQRVARFVLAGTVALSSSVSVAALQSSVAEARSVCDSADPPPTCGDVPKPKPKPRPPAPSPTPPPVTPVTPHDLITEHCMRDTPLLDDQADVSPYDKVHVVYAVPDGKPDRTAAIRPAIQANVTKMMSRLNERDPNANIRFDWLASNQGPCLDITTVYLPYGPGRYKSAIDVQTDIIYRTPLGRWYDPAEFFRRGKKYLVFMDGWNHVSGAGGQAVGVPSTVTVTNIGGKSPEKVGLADELNGGPYTTPMHELFHTFSAVSPSAPNYSTVGGGYHVGDQFDLMSYGQKRCWDQLEIDSDQRDYWGPKTTWGIAEGAVPLDGNTREASQIEKFGYGDWIAPTMYSNKAEAARVTARNGNNGELRWAQATDDRAVASYEVIATQLTAGSRDALWERAQGTPTKLDYVTPCGTTKLRIPALPVRIVDRASQAAGRTTTTLVAGATYELKISARDGAGNVSAPMTIQVFIP